MPRTKVKRFPIIVGVIALVVGAYFGINYLNDSGVMEKLAPSKGGSSAGPKLSKKDSKEAIKIGVVTWGGYAGGQYFNGGFKPSKESKFYKEYGLLVEFIVLDDFNASREAWKSDRVDLMWVTVDAFPTELDALKKFEPQIIFQADWSRGGDVIVVRRGINNVQDLRGKKIAFAYGTPSHSFLLWLLDAGNMSQSDIKAVQVNNAIDAAGMFKAGQVDAAVVWSPDDEDCITKVNGSKRLKSTREATHIIADGFFAKKSYIDANQDRLKSLVEGWMRGAAEVNSNTSAKAEAAQILADGLNMDLDFCKLAIDNVRLCTFGDNKGFFAIDGCNACVTAEQLYTDMSSKYLEAGVISSMPPAWRMVSNTSIIRSINLAGAEHEAEGMQDFSKATAKEVKAEAFASKAVSVVFSTGSYRLDDNAKYIIDTDVAPVLKAFGNARCRIEGNTDNIGSQAGNITLSEKRAAAFVNYLVENFYFDRDRFISKGNGSSNPVASNDTESGRAKNRRTEFQLLN